MRQAKIALLLALAGASVLVAALLPPIPQSQAYHGFADDRRLLGLDNALNVLSNAAFVAVGAAGLWRLRRSSFREPWERRAYAAVFAGVLLTGFGSAYYHANPTDATLFWDRLPLAPVFMALLCITVAERIDPTAGRRMLLPLMGAAVASLLWWRATGDLRPYGLVQFYPLLAVPLMVGLFPPRYTHGRHFLGAALCYALAKACETLDGPIFSLGYAVSGHTLKHVLAAASVGCLVAMLRRRRPLPAVAAPEPRDPTLSAT